MPHNRHYLPYKGGSQQIHVVRCSSQVSGESTESSSWLAITPKALFLLNQDDCCSVKLAIPLKEVQAKMSLSSIIGENGVVGTGNESSSAADQMAVGISFTLRQQGVVAVSYTHLTLPTILLV